MRPLDYITAFVILGCFLLMQFGKDEASKTAGTVLISAVSYYIGRKIERREK